jgi:hypothetical protein
MNPNTCGYITPLLTRRDVLSTLACGFGWLAFSGLTGRSLAAAETGPLAPKPTHFSGAGEARHLSLHARRAVALWIHSITSPSSMPTTTSRASGPAPSCLGPMEIPAAGKKRPVDLGPLPANLHARG